MRSFLQIEHAARPGRDSTIRSNERAAHSSNQPATTAQKKLEQQLNGRAAVRSQLQLRDALNQRPAVVAQRKLANRLSSRAAVQREEMSDDDELMQQKAAATAQREEISDDEELMQQKRTTAAVQREEMQDDDELLQGKFEPVQRQGSDADILGNLEDEEPLQGQFAPDQREVMPDEDELLQAKFEPLQGQRLDAGAMGETEDEEVLQGKRTPVQREAMPDDDELVQTKRKPVQRQESNQTGLPDTVKSGVETLSGLSLDDVRVHYNSAAPAPLQAAAYAQGTDIHLAPGQERHLPHEAWHVVQQKQGRVQATRQARGVAINDDVGLEREADVMGAKALQMSRADHVSQPARHAAKTTDQRPVYQRVSAAGVLQLIYLWDRAKMAPPHWSDAEEPPDDYLASGRHDDGVHGDDALYARLGSTDLYYGVSYEMDEGRMTEFLKAIQKIGEERKINIGKSAGFAAAIRIYEAEVGEPLIDVEAMKGLYGGSSGWEHYPSYLPNKSESSTSILLKKLNPDLPWAKDVTGLACQVTMIEAIKRAGSVRFLLDGLVDVKGILEGKGKWSGNVTAHELRFALALLNQTINVGKDEQIVPRDGVNVFFYIKRRLIPAAWLLMDKTQLAQAMARKLAEEEEWDEEDEEEGIPELQHALAGEFTEEQLLEVLSLP